MDYEITIGGRSSKVALTRAPGSPERYAFHDEATGRSGHLVVVDRAPARLILAIGDKMYAVRPRAKAPGRVDFILNGEPVSAELSTAKAPAEARVDRVAAPEVIASQFPAKVVRVPVSVGASVRARQTLVVLEAMKMVTHLDAPRDGTVLEIFVNEGEMVARGTKLLRLKFA
jgi:biotin carboxyl carrier protein